MDLDQNIIHTLNPLNYTYCTNSNKQTSTRFPLVPELQSSHGTWSLVLPSEVLSATAATQLCVGVGGVGEGVAF